MVAPQPEEEPEISMLAVVAVDRQTLFWELVVLVESVDLLEPPHQEPSIPHLFGVVPEAQIAKPQALQLPVKLLPALCQVPERRSQWVGVALSEQELPEMAVQECVVGAVEDQRRIPQTGHLLVEPGEADMFPSPSARH